MRFKSFCAAAAHAPMTTVATARTSSGVRMAAICGPKSGSAMRKQAVDAHLRHGAGEQHSDGRRRLGIRGGQPGVEGHERHFDREAREHADGEPRHYGAEMRCDHLRELAGRGHLRELDEVHGAGRALLVVARRWRESESKSATEPAMV